MAKKPTKIPSEQKKEVDAFNAMPVKKIPQAVKTQPTTTGSDKSEEKK